MPQGNKEMANNILNPETDAEKGAEAYHLLSDMCMQDLGIAIDALQKFATEPPSRTDAKDAIKNLEKTHANFCPYGKGKECKGMTIS